MRDDKKTGKQIMQMYRSGRKDEAVEAVVKLMRPWVGRLISRYQNYNEADDMMQEGCLAIVDNFDKYDPNIATPVTFFSRYVQGAIYDYHVSQQGIKRHDVTTKRQIDRAVNELEALGEDPNVDNIYRMLGGALSREVIIKNKALFDTSTGTIRLDKEAEEGNGCLLDNYISNEDTPEKAYEKKELSEEVQSALAKLTPEEQQLLSGLFFEDLTMAQMEKLMNLNQLTAKKIRTAAFLKLKANQKLRDYIGAHMEPAGHEFGISFEDDAPMHFGEDELELELDL